MGSIMDLKNLLDEEINLILSSDYEIVVSETVFVPTVDDPLITYPNLKTMQQKVKLIETCVLYIDIRRSTELNLTHRKETVTKLYSAFIRSMVKAAEHYGGKVRGIIGDRVMVVFDFYQCCTNALNTAILMHSISEYLLNKHFKKMKSNAGSASITEKCWFLKTESLSMVLKISPINRSFGSEDPQMWPLNLRMQRIKQPPYLKKKQ